MAISGFKEKNPSLFQKYAHLLSDQPRSQAGCLSLFVSTNNGKQPIIGKPVRILLTIVGSLLALLIIASLVFK
jgi:hypothetical protein